MKSTKILRHSFIHALGVLAYVALVAIFMQNGEKVFGRVEDTIFGPIMVLMLLVVSATISGSLVFLKPAMMYFNGQKKEGIQMLMFTVMWLLAIMIVVMLVVLAI